MICNENNCSIIASYNPSSDSLIYWIYMFALLIIIGLPFISTVCWAIIYHHISLRRWYMKGGKK